MFTATPRTPLVLTLSGILPFIGLAAGMIWFRGEIAMMSTLAIWMLVYAAVICSFVAGIRWGVGIAQGVPPSDHILGLSVLPPLLAWVAVGVYFRFAEAGVFLAMAVIFGALYMWDRGSANLPDWYRRLRVWPSLGAALCLLTAYLLLR